MRTSLKLLIAFLSYGGFCTGSDGGFCGGVNVQRKQAKKGFHRDIITDIEWNIRGFNDSSTSCQFLLIENLPSGLYVDLDEVRNGISFGGPKVLCEDKIDTELLAHKASNHQIFVYPNTQFLHSKYGRASTHCILPVHLRYHRPQSNDGFASVALRPPRILVKCNGMFEKAGCDLPTVQAYCDAEEKSACDWIVLESLIEESAQSRKALNFKVPVGLEEHGTMVTAMTLFVTVGGCLLVVWGMWNTRDHEKTG